MPGSVVFSVAMLALTQWSLAFLAQITAPELVDKLFWTRLQYLGFLIFPVAWLSFAWQYNGRRLLWGSLYLLSVVPLVTLLLVFTNDVHGLVWQESSLKTINGLPMLVVMPGGWYWGGIAFLYGCFLVGSLLLLTSQRYEISSLRPRQALGLVVGLALPWFGLALQLAGLSTFNLIPLVFAVTGIVTARYALSFRFTDKSPLAHQVVINSLNVGVLVVDPNLIVVDANAAAAAILQRPLPQLISQPLATVWPELATQYEYVTQSARDIPLKGESEVNFYEVRHSPLFDWRKLPSSSLLQLHDISLRKHQESLREDMTHSMVHDLRSPISNSLFALQMLKGSLEQDAASPDNQDLLNMTFANTEKVLQLVNNILDVNRLENGQIPLKRTAVSLNSLIAEVVDRQKAHATEKQIHIRQQVAPDLPPGWADAGLLERVLQNLLDNSLKFCTVGGTITITAVAVANSHTGATHLEVSVSDDGPGLPPEISHAAFDKFVTGESKQSGNGLGLAFCQMALAAHGEKIWVESNHGPGATFTFTLPTIPAQPKPAMGETAVSPPPAPMNNNNVTLTPKRPGMVVSWH